MKVSQRTISAAASGVLLFRCAVDLGGCAVLRLSLPPGLEGGGVVLLLIPDGGQ